MQVKILRPKFLSFPWSKWKNLSDHQVEKFLNNYMRITDELVFTQIYSILHLISIQKWKKRLNSERKYRTCDYSLFGAYYSNIRILFIISKRTEYEYEYHYSVFYYSNIRITNYSLQHWLETPLLAHSCIVIAILATKLTMQSEILILTQAAADRQQELIPFICEILWKIRS